MKEANTFTSENRMVKRTRLMNRIIYYLGTVSLGLFILAVISCAKMDEIDIPDDIIDPSEALPFVSIDAGFSHSLAIKSDGTLWGWGENFYGQLDQGADFALKPVRIGDSYSKIAAGGSKDEYCFDGCHHHGVSLGIKTTGSLWSWGVDFFGSPNEYHVREEIATGYIQVEASNNGSGAYAGHFLALKADSTLWAWGVNIAGQVGDGTNDTKFEPIAIGSGYVAVSAGQSYSLALKTGGSLWAWGSNYYGELGDGTHTYKNMPVNVGTGYVAIAAGGAHALALKADGKLVAWGRNNFGQLGIGNHEDKVRPVLIGTGFSAVSAGEYHSMALKSDGTLWSWGYNIDGQLGDSTAINKNVPVLIGAGFSAISAGKDFSLALKTDGTLWAWGKNDFGQLGDGTTLNQNIPVQIGPN